MEVVPEEAATAMGAPVALQERGGRVDKAGALLVEAEQGVEQVAASEVVERVEETAGAGEVGVPRRRYSSLNSCSRRAAAESS